MAPVRNAGAVFDAPTAPPASSTVSVKLVEADSGGVPSSVTVTVMSTVAGASSASGVPEKVRVPAAKPSQSGRSPPSVGAAAYVRPSSSGSVAAGTV